MKVCPIVCLIFYKHEAAATSDKHVAATIVSSAFRVNKIIRSIFHSNRLLLLFWVFVSIDISMVAGRDVFDLIRWGYTILIGYGM